MYAMLTSSSTTLEFSTYVKILYFFLRKGLYTRLYPNAVSYISPRLLSEYKPVSAISPGLVDEHDFQFFGLLSIFLFAYKPMGLYAR